MLSHRSLRPCLFLFQSFSVFINLVNFFWAIFKAINTFSCSAQSAVMLVQGIFYFRFCIFQVSIYVGSFYNFLHFDWDYPSLTSHLFLFYLTSLSIYIIGILKFSSANSNIWVISWSLFIFSPLIMDYTICFFASLVIFLLHAGHCGWYIVGRIDYIVFL